MELRQFTCISMGAALGVVRPHIYEQRTYIKYISMHSSALWEKEAAARTYNMSLALPYSPRI